MRCAEVSEVLSAYADGEVAGHAALELQAHMALCQSCRARLGAIEALQSKLAEVMAEPLATADLSDHVMASVAPRRRPPGIRWAWAGAACLLVLLGLGLGLGPKRDARVAEHAPSQPQHHTVAIPDEPAPRSAANPKTVEAPVLQAKHRSASRRTVRDVKHPPVREEPALDKPGLSVASKTVDGRIVTTVEVRSGAAVYRARLVRVVLPPNTEAATIVRPELRVVSSDERATGPTGG